MCQYHCNGVTVLEDFFVVQNRPFLAVALVGGESQAVDPVRSGYILIGQHPVNARNFFGLRSIDGQNIGVRNLSLDQLDMQGILRQLQPQVGAEIPCARNLGNSRGTRHTGTKKACSVLQFGPQFFPGYLAPHQSRGIHYGVDKRFVAGTPTEVFVFLKPCPDFFSGGIVVLIKQSFCGNDKSGGAVSALRGSVDHPGILQWVEALFCSDSLNRNDMGFVRNPFHFVQT